MAEEQCNELVKHAENIGFEKADDKYPLSYRTNKRCWEDDETLAQSLWDKLSASEFFKYALTGASGINSRLRYCRYDNSEVFNIHKDGRYYKTNNEFSKLTFLMYLSNSDDYVGGSTRFFSEHNQQSLLCDIKGNQGDLLIFDHTLWHEGGKIESGTKHILRSDVLFRERESSKSCVDHLGYIWKIVYANKTLITGGRDTKIKVWGENGNLIQTISEHESSVLDLVAAGDRLFSCSRDSTIVSYQRKADQYALKDKKITAHGTVLSIDSLYTGELISSGSDGMIRIWNDELVLQCEVAGHNGWCWQVIAINKTIFLSIGSDGMLKKWCFYDGKIDLVLETKISHSALRAVDFIDDSAWIGTESGDIISVNINDGSIHSQQKLHIGIVREIKIHNELIYTCGEDGCVYKVNTENNNAQLLTLHNDFATSIVIVNSQVHSGGYDGKVRSGGLAGATD